MGKLTFLVDSALLSEFGVKLVNDGCPLFKCLKKWSV